MFTENALSFYSRRDRVNKDCEKLLKTCQADLDKINEALPKDKPNNSD